MIKVLHYDHHLDLASELHAELLSRFYEHPFVEYEFIDPGNETRFEYIREIIESKLPNADVLLIHPGIRGQDVVIHQYPVMYPHLRIGLITPSPDQYESSDKIVLLDCLNLDQIVNFVYSCKK